MTAVSYKLKLSKLVTLISTVHNDNAIHKNGKPELIFNYSATFNQPFESANCGRAMQRWLMAYYNMINIAMYNLCYLYADFFLNKISLFETSKQI